MSSQNHSEAKRGEGLGLPAVGCACGQGDNSQKSRTVSWIARRDHISLSPTGCEGRDQGPVFSWDPVGSGDRPLRTRPRQGGARCKGLRGICVRVFSVASSPMSSCVCWQDLFHWTLPPGHEVSQKMFLLRKGAASADEVRKALANQFVSHTKRDFVDRAQGERAPSLLPAGHEALESHRGSHGVDAGRGKLPRETVTLPKVHFAENAGCCGAHSRTLSQRLEGGQDRLQG